jgi:hypothetical protein
MKVTAYIEQRNLEQMTWIIEGLSLRFNGNSPVKGDCKVCISGDVTDLNQLTRDYSTFKKDRLFLEPKNAS